MKINEIKASCVIQNWLTIIVFGKFKNALHCVLYSSLLKSSTLLFNWYNKYFHPKIDRYQRYIMC